MADTLMSEQDRETLRLLYRKMATRWVDNLLYWVGPRVVQSTQTVEYITAQAEHCAVGAVRHLRREAEHAGRPFLDLHPREDAASVPLEPIPHDMLAMWEDEGGAAHEAAS